LASISNYPEHLDLDPAPVYSMPLKLSLLPFRVLNFEHNTAKKCIIPHWQIGVTGVGDCAPVASVLLTGVML
jgi:hypothetical protein